VVSVLYLVLTLLQQGLLGVALGAVLGALLISMLHRGLVTLSVQKRMSVNSGFKRSAIYAAALVLPFLLLVALVGRIPTFGAVAGFFAITGTTLLPVWKGGGFCIKNVTMRLALARAQCIPWRYEGLLYFSVERVLMIRQGGSFRFIHRMLQEHLAAHPLVTPR
jgi:hypothetical protein